MSPIANVGTMLVLGSAYREAGRYEEAITEFKNCIKLTPNNKLAYQGLATTYALAGRYEEVREAWSEVLKLDPKTSFEKFRKRCPYRPENCERKIAYLHMAGIK